MAEISERITAHLRQFADAVLDQQFDDAVRDHFLPLPMVRPFGTELFTTRAEVAEDLETFWAPWHSSGVRSIAPTVIGLRSFALGVYLADIEWTFRDGNGSETALIHTTYGFRQDGDRFGISAIFGHDEVFQRPVCATATA